MVESVSGVPILILYTVVADPSAFRLVGWVLHSLAHGPLQPRFGTLHHDKLPLIITNCQTDLRSYQS
jgi:hypothetical protein